MTFLFIAICAYVLSSSLKASLILIVYILAWNLPFLIIMQSHESQIFALMTARDELI